MQRDQKVGRGEVAIAVPIAGCPGGVGRYTIFESSGSEDFHQIDGLETSIQIGVPKGAAKVLLDDLLSVEQIDDAIVVRIVTAVIDGGTHPLGHSVDVQHGQRSVTVKIAQQRLVYCFAWEGDIEELGIVEARSIPETVGDIEQLRILKCNGRTAEQFEIDGRFTFEFVVVPELPRLISGQVGRQKFPSQLESSPILHFVFVGVEIVDKTG